MTALTQDRNTPRREGVAIEPPVKGATTLYAGALVCLDANGFAVPGATATGLTAIGRAEEQAINTGADGAVRARVRHGTFRWSNSAGGDEVTLAHVGQACWVVDDQTVARTSGSATRSKAGIVADVDELGVWVDMGVATLNSPASALLAANNLADLGSAAAARAELATDRLYLTLAGVALDGSDTYHLPAPRAGTITAIRTVIDGALTTGNATITASIGGDPVTGGVVTITQAGSAAGDSDLAEPSAENAVEPGDSIELTVGGTNDAARTATVVVEITF